MIETWREREAREAAQRAANEDLGRRVGAVVAQALDEREKEVFKNRRRESRQRRGFLVIAGLVSAAAFIGGGVCTYFAVAGFRDATVHSSDAYAILAIESSSELEFQPKIELLSNLAAPDYSTYSLFFPRMSIGKRWTLLLSRGASLKNFTRVVGSGVTERSANCFSQLGRTDSSQRGCQVFEGVVREEPLSGVNLHLLSLTACDKQSGLHDDPAYEGTEPAMVQGTTTQNIRNVSWATKQVLFPDFPPWNVSVMDAALMMAGIPSSYNVPQNIKGCQVLFVPGGYDFFKEFPSPQQQSSTILYWNQTLSDNYHAPEVVLRRSGADSDENLLIIFAGILVAIGGGFLPPLFESLAIHFIR